MEIGGGGMSRFPARMFRWVAIYGLAKDAPQPPLTLGAEPSHPRAYVYT